MDDQWTILRRESRVKVLLINPPYQTMTSNLGVGHQVPLGLLMVGGPLMDAGHCVRLLDAECLHLGLDAIVREVRRFAPDVIMTGHAGSTPAHPICVDMLRAIKLGVPTTFTVDGGVYPTYHARQILERECAVDLIVRGEGEPTALDVMRVVPLPDRHRMRELENIAGIAWRGERRIVITRDRDPIRDLDQFHTGWELIENWDNYKCFGLGRAAIVQFSRGCPHRCTYCGQHGFWVSWRHRDPIRLVDEIEMLYRRHDVRFITLADENPTTRRDTWSCLLQELAARKLPIHFFATIRASDIVRDADLLPLYRCAGILYVLLGIDATSDTLLRQIRKGSTTGVDLQACRLLKGHGIFSVMGHIVGLQDESRKTFIRALRQLVQYDGDYLNAMYATPQDWTAFGQEVSNRTFIEPDQRKWDYRHQVIGQTRLSPWQLFVCVKWLELCFHLRCDRLREIFHTRDRFRRQQIVWTYYHIGCVWVGEIVEFVTRAIFRRWRNGRIRSRRRQKRSRLQLTVIAPPPVAAAPARP